MLPCLCALMVSLRSYHLSLQDNSFSFGALGAPWKGFQNSVGQLAPTYIFPNQLQNCSYNPPHKVSLKIFNTQWYDSSYFYCRGIVSLAYYSRMINTRVIVLNPIPRGKFAHPYLDVTKRKIWGAASAPNFLLLILSY